MDNPLYLTLSGLAGMALGHGMAPLVTHIPGKIYRGWVQECADVLGQADQLAGIAHLEDEQVARAQHVGMELELAMAKPGPIQVAGHLPWIMGAVLGILFVAIAAVMPLGATALAWMTFAAWVALMAAVDWESTLLPDMMTLPLLWAGLIASSAGWLAVPLQDAVIGASAGYGCLRMIYAGHRAITGQEGMGHGDFKLLAAIGAWLGWQAIIPVLFIAALSGAVAITMAKATGTSREGGVIPFGPFLAVAAMVVAITGVELTL